MTLSPSGRPVNRLAILIVSGRQAIDLMQQLRENGFTFTQVDSSGGMIQEPSLSLLIGFHDSRMDLLLKLVRRYCKPQKQYIPAQIHIQPGFTTALPMIEARVGGALIYIIDVERFEQI